MFQITNQMIYIYINPNKSPFSYGFPTVFPWFVDSQRSSNAPTLLPLKPRCRGLAVEALGDHGPAEGFLGHQGGADAFELLQTHLGRGALW